MQQVEQSNQYTAPQILRFLGVGALVVSMIVFLIQGIDILSAASRHWLSLGLTAAMTGVGFFCLKKLNEQNGARTFLTMAAAMIPVHFSQLGAMLFSLVSDGASAVPGIFTYSAASIGGFGLTASATIALVIPLALLGFALISREHYRQLTAGYFLLNALILIPLRSPEVAILVSLIQIALIEFFDQRFISTHFSSRRHAIAARSLMWFPVVVVLGRASFYDPTGYFLGFVLGLAAHILMHVLPRTGNSWFKEASKFVGVLSGCLAWMVIGVTLLQNNVINEDFTPAIVLMPTAAIIFYGSYITDTVATLLRASGVIVLFLSIVGMITFGANFTEVGVTGIFAGAAIVAWACHEKSLPILITGAGFFSIGVITVGVDAVQVYMNHSWIALAVLGIATVLGASLLERPSDRLVETWQKLKSW